MWHKINISALFGDFRVDNNMFHVICDCTTLFPNILVDNNTISNFLEIAFLHCNNMLNGAHSLIDRSPERQNFLPAKIEFLGPLFNLVTLKYDDMEVFLIT